ncbi:MAG: hypothetical protein MRZ79_02975 [Bacteroidia bacterium]|nr:hypothetical protein [Bacteroidia bacterium]
MGKFFTIHRAGKEALKNFFAVSFFILLIAGIGGAIVWFLMVRPLQNKTEPEKTTVKEQVDPSPPTPSTPETKKPEKPEGEKKPWEKDAEEKKEKPKSKQVNKLF